MANGKPSLSGPPRTGPGRARGRPAIPPLSAGSAAHARADGRVRDAHTWSRRLTEAAHSFAGHAEVAFAPHHRPLWGRERITEFLSVQRDVQTRTRT
ncbi:hypothetical protein [Streptomyces sp. NPDC047071]|uniref:hypothetical protein n=1 Tax=Streptomyces sp. NPDC047071 TaxID=3154808 RepID=UPI00345523A3